MQLFSSRLGEAAAPEAMRAVTDFASYTQTYALQLRKIKEKPHQGNRKALGLSALNAIRLIDLANAGDGLDWPLSSTAIRFCVRRWVNTRSA
jgi:hypothetical protein